MFYEPFSYLHKIKWQITKSLWRWIQNETLKVKNIYFCWFGSRVSTTTIKLKIHIKWCCSLIFVLLQITVVRKLKCNWIYLIPLLLQVKDENCVDLIGIEIRRTRIQTFASLNLWQTSKKKDERNMKRKWLYFASKVMTEMNFR